ncbi:MAG: universal stress protein [Geminicoccaceae bacterium]|nr:universal stress protein [Geminicoccaceae bacterium]MCB9968309.1 universal stress protein [Geminicoccaceae bacterium]HRY23769.1 universal stress protein [Geminicoccaceae bacterium]
MTAPVLCAVDFSPDAEAALLWSCAQAELAQAPLLLLHVIHDPAASPGFYQRPDDGWLRPLADVAEQMLGEFLDRLRQEHPDQGRLKTLETRLVPGLPAGRIVEVASEAGAVLVVVGSRGRTGLPHILLGSVAERVVQIAPMPVVVVKRAATVAADADQADGGRK